MNIKIWHSAEEFAEYICFHTDLKNHSISYEKLYESDASKPRDFHALPDHIKQILYLDSPDIVVEIDGEPILSVEISTEAGTGHNAFQRFGRIAASVEKGVPAFYIFPDAVIIKRRSGADIGWDRLNPSILYAFARVMDLHQIPALIYYYPSDFQTHQNNPSESPNISNKGLKKERSLRFPSSPDSTHNEMRDFFSAINEVLNYSFVHGPIQSRYHLLKSGIISKRVEKMRADLYSKTDLERIKELSPLKSTIEIPTASLHGYIKSFFADYKPGRLLQSRAKTLIYHVDSKFRGDPYPGALAAIDYMATRNGNTFEDRSANLVLCWGQAKMTGNDLTISRRPNTATINDFISDTRRSENKNLLSRVESFSDLSDQVEVSRYYMQVRYGSMFSKSKHIRMYAYFADAIIFDDGVLWRDG